MGTTPHIKPSPTNVSCVDMSKSASVSKNWVADVSGHNRKQPSPRVLVVDDSTDSRQLTLEVLTNSGYAAEGVVDGAAAWEALQTSDYNLVITDNHMPRMTGVEMITKIRACHMTVPIIMATSQLPVFEFARRPWIQPDQALQRPYTNDELMAAVRKVLGPGGGYPTPPATVLPKQF
jgi:DNA-binding response OmpR family regulator